jgi:RecA/RadA recombinase
VIKIITASEYYKDIKQFSPLSSGDPMLDALLRGGFVPGPVYFLYGPKKILSSILMKTAVNSLKNNDEEQPSHLIAYIDGENRFDPYLISKLAVSNHLNPSIVLKHIIVSRIFTWDQMVEVLYEKLSTIDENKINLVLVDGITSMFEKTSQLNDSIRKKGYNGPITQNSLNSKAFQDLKMMFLGLNKIIERFNPIIILTGPLHSKSKNRPAGGHILSHFSGIIVGIHENLRYIDYSLDQHPFLPNQKERFWSSPLSRQSPQKRNKFSKSIHNLTLDKYLTKFSKTDE